MTTRGKVLVVNDKSDIVETVSLCFAQEGFEDSTDFDGEQTLEVARREQPDVVLLTARTVSDKKREEFLQTWSGAEMFMYKPFDLEELVEKVKGLAGERRLVTL